ncbi:MAG: hypothetical protein J1G06_06545, partial [Oscillospiraceae bacterium]|nr:hypothetical protein [Oscillospiraceae bacterium]
NIGTFGLIEPDIRYSLKRDDLIPAEREANAREGQNPFDEAARISKTEENRTRMEEVWNIVKTDDDSNPFAKIDDEEQFQRYKAVLGEENMPESLDSWKDLKYNNIAAYKELQWRYKYANQPYMQSRFDYTMPNGEKNFIPEKAVIYPAVTIAGKGSDTELRAAKRLVEDYGGNIGEWRKRVGKIESSKYIFDVHWYEFNKKQYEMKLKYRKER